MTTYTYTVTFTVAALSTDTAKVGDTFTVTVKNKSRKGYDEVAEKALKTLGLGRVESCNSSTATVREDIVLFTGRVGYNATIFLDVKVEEME